MTKYAGADHIDIKKIKMSAFGRKVANILGQAYAGIYHLGENIVAKMDWADDHYIAVNVMDNLATYDFDILTRLIVLCHDACVRMEVRPSGPHRIKLAFTSRKGRTGDIYERHPTIEDHIKDIREKFGLENYDE